MKIQSTTIEPVKAGPDEKGSGSPSVSPGREPNINAFDLLVAVAKYKKEVLWAGASAGILVGLISLWLPNMYTGTTRILPPQQSQSLASAMMGQLGPLAGFAGRDLGLKNPNDIYVAMLESRIAADALVQRFDLRRRYHSKSTGKAREELAKRTAVLSGKDGIINVLYDDEDPQRAADISNAYVEELSRISRTLAITEASQRRLFYEKQLQLAKEQLSDAESALKATQESTGLIEPGEQSRAIIDSAASLRAQIAMQEVQFAGLRGQWSQLERASGQKRKGDLQVATEKVPQAGMEYIRAYREVKYHETIFEMIAKQYELAKMDEVRDAAVIQVLDAAIPPENKSGPGRLGMALMGGLGTMLAVMLLAILRELPLLSAEQHAKLLLAKCYLLGN